MSNVKGPFRPRVHETDGFMANLVGYVPAEIVGVYIAVDNLVAALPAEQKMLASWAILGVLALLTPFYMSRGTAMEVDNVRKPAVGRQVIASTIAFPVWVFAIGGPFTQMQWYSEALGAIVLAIVSLALPIFFKSPAQKERKSRMPPYSGGSGA